MVSTKDRHASSELARLCDNAAPHHTVDWCDEDIVHILCAMIATPTSGTRTAK